MMIKYVGSQDGDDLLVIAVSVLILICPIFRIFLHTQLLPISRNVSIQLMDKQADHPSNLLIGNLVRPR